MRQAPGARRKLPELEGRGQRQTSRRRLHRAVGKNPIRDSTESFGSSVAGARFPGQTREAVDWGDRRASRRVGKEAAREIAPPGKRR